MVKSTHQFFGAGQRRIDGDTEAERICVSASLVAVTLIEASAFVGDRRERQFACEW
jgi:hypothetical protein